MIDQDKLRVWRYHERGYSIRQIAGALDIPKSSVERALLSKPTVPLNLAIEPEMELKPDDRLASHLAQTIQRQQQELDDERDSLERERSLLRRKAQQLADREAALANVSNEYAVATESHAQEVAALAGQQHDLAAEKHALEQKQARFEEELKSFPERQQEYLQFQIQQHQRALVERHNGLVQEVLEDSDSTWTADEVNDLLRRAASLRDKVKAHCDSHLIEENELYIYRALNWLIGKVELFQKHNRKLFSSNIRFCCGKETIKQLKDSIIREFSQKEATHTNDALSTADETTPVEPGDLTDIPTQTHQQDGNPTA